MQVNVYREGGKVIDKYPHPSTLSATPDGRLFVGKPFCNPHAVYAPGQWERAEEVEPCAT